MSVIDLNAWKQKKKQEEKRNVLLVSHITGKVTAKPTHGVEAISDAFPKLKLDRLQRVKVSMEKIDNLLADLKRLNEQYNGLK